MTLQSRTMLIAEDQRIFQESALRATCELGRCADVRCVPSYAAAVSARAQRPADLVLIDDRLDDGDGGPRLAMGIAAQPTLHGCRRIARTFSEPSLIGSEFDTILVMPTTSPEQAAADLFVRLTPLLQNPRCCRIRPGR